MSPTITTPAMTQAGMILGTAAYMSRRSRRRGGRRTSAVTLGVWLRALRDADRQRAFQGEDVTDTLAAVLRGEPDWTALPAATPPAIRGCSDDRLNGTVVGVWRISPMHGWSSMRH